MRFERTRRLEGSPVGMWAVAGLVEVGVTRPRTGMTAEKTFEGFFEAESATLFRRLCLVTGNRFEAEEVMQDAFLKVFEKWERVRGMDDPTGYLYRAAFNIFRKRSRRAALAVRRTLGLVPHVDEFDAVDARNVLTEAMSKLPVRQRAAIVLIELLGYSSEAAGEILGVRPVTVRVLASQARTALRVILERQDG